MTSPILVTGGTGRLGRHVVRRLRDAGSNVRVLSRRNREAEDGIRFLSGDLATGEGIKAAVEGVETIVHLAGTAGSAKGAEDKARTLVRAASQAGAPHLVYISVVAADMIPVVSRVDPPTLSYSASKPWTPTRWRPGSSSSPSTSRPAWCPTWVGRGCTAQPSCSAATFGPVIGGVGRSCQCGCRVRPPVRAGRALTWLPSRPWDTGH